MKVYKIISALLVACIICLGVPQITFGQTETLGIVHYTALKDWVKTSKDNVVTFSNSNLVTKGFCTLSLYGATQGTGNPQADFSREWNNLVVKPLKADANPETKSRSVDGWAIIASGAYTEYQGNKAIVFLTVFSGFGKTVSVLAILNEQAYLEKLSEFVADIKIDKTSPTSYPTIMQNHQPGKPVSMVYTAPQEWREYITR